MSTLQEKKRLTPEERKALREKFSVHNKENEKIYRHYGDLNGGDFKIYKNKNCEIFILDWSKGMFIDDCENCTIIVGPIDGSIFIRTSKNCKISVIARQVRFRESNDINIFTYCPSDPAVESSFNIFFAPFNAFFPHLSELFLKAGLNPEEKNHISTPYDFTPSQELGGGLPHYLQLPEDKFEIKIIRDGEAPLDEMFKGYSKKEPFLINKADELPKFEESESDNNLNTNNNINIDDFGFGDNNDNNNNNINNNNNNLNDVIKVNEVNNNQNNQNNLMNMDDFISMNNLNNNNISNMNNISSITNNTNTNVNNTNIDFGMFNFNSNNQSQLDYNNNINNINNINNNTSFKSYEISKEKMTKEREEEIRLEQIKEKTKELRQERIRQLIEKEAKLKNEIISKAMNYMNEFNKERKKRIELNHQKLLEKENNPNKGNNSGNLWENLGSNMTNNSSPADRMKEAILNRSQQEQNK